MCISNPCTVKLFDGKCSKILNTFVFPLCFQIKMFVIRTETRKMFVQTGKILIFRSSLIWVCAVCLGLFGRQ